MALSLLLIEDDADDARLFERMLGRNFPNHYDVAHASNIEQALEYVSRPESDGLDVIVLDLGLPDSVELSGLDRMAEATIRRVPIIILSGVEDESLAQNAIKGNAQDYINKQQMTASAIDRAVRYAIERQRSQVELNISRERFRHFADIATDRFWEMGPDLRFIDANGTLQDEYEPQKSGLLGRTIWEVTGFAPLNAETWDPLIEEMIQRHEINDFEITFTDQNDDLTYWSFSASPIYESAEFLGYRGTAHDISHQKGIEKELRALNARKDKFFSIIAHDLRSPFSSLMGAAGFFRDGIYNANQDDARELGSMMYDTARRACNLVDDLLQWSRLQLLKDALKPENVKIASVISEAFELTSSLATAKGVELIQDVIGVNTVYIDQQAINSIVRNLVNNGVKFTPKGGRVVVQVVPAEEGMVILSVTDTGIGMSADKIAELRSIDEVVSTKGTDGEQGTGLGLVLSDELITKSHGTLRIESEDGAGTTVTITIPTGPLDNAAPDPETMDGDRND